MACSAVGWERPYACPPVAMSKVAMTEKLELPMFIQCKPNAISTSLSTPGGVFYATARSPNRHVCPTGGFPKPQYCCRFDLEEHHVARVGLGGVERAHVNAFAAAGHHFLDRVVARNRVVFNGRVPVVYSRFLAVDHQESWIEEELWKRYNAVYDVQRAREHAPQRDAAMPADRDRYP